MGLLRSLRQRSSHTRPAPAPSEPAIPPAPYAGVSGLEASLIQQLPAPAQPTIAIDSSSTTSGHITTSTVSPLAGDRKRKLAGGYHSHLCSLLEATNCTGGGTRSQLPSAPSDTKTESIKTSEKISVVTRRGSQLTPPASESPEPPPVLITANNCTAADTPTTPPRVRKRQCSKSGVEVTVTVPAHTKSQPPQPSPRMMGLERTNRTRAGAADYTSPVKSVGLPPSSVLERHASILTDYERNEIQSYQEVWFIGERARKIQATEGASGNNGYDDHNSRYIAKKHDHIAYRYEILSGLGKGAFGDVYKAFDHATEQVVALKVIRNEKRFHRQGKVEVKVLNMLRAQDPDHTHGCVHMINYFVFRSHLCITFEMHYNDLYTELKAGGFTGFDPEYVRDVAEDTLGCLRLLYANSIVHADLKPENMLLASPHDRSVMVIDYGSSCFVHEKVHTYIQSRYYRSPEVMLGLGYGTGIDMWSVGCILVELTTGSPLFPAKNEQELMLLQTEVLGIPPDYLLNQGTRSYEFFKKTPCGFQPLRQTDRKGRRRVPNGATLSEVCGNKDPIFVDFVRRCLTWDPADRLTPIEALRHPYVTMGSPVVKQVSRCYSEDGLVAMLTRHDHRTLTKKTSALSTSNKSLNDSGVSSQGSETSEDVFAMEHECTAV